MPRSKQSREAIIEKAKKIVSGEYTGTKLYPIAAGKESAIKYLLKRKINPEEVFTDSTDLINNVKDSIRQNYNSKKVNQYHKKKDAGEVPSQLQNYYNKKAEQEQPSTDEAKSKIDGILSQIRNNSASSFLTQFSTTQRGDGHYNKDLYGQYKKWFRSVYKPVIQPLSETVHR